MLAIHYKEYGTTGIPLIIIHGFLGSLDNWHTLSTEWSKHTIHVFSLDMRNHGKSPHTPEHSIELMAKDVIDFMDQHHLAEACVLGHSMGGKVAMELALRFPQRVAKLIVADMAPRGYKHGHEDVFNAIRSINLDTIDNRKDAEAAMMPFLGDSGTRQFVLKNLERNPGGGYRWKFNFDSLYDNYDNILQPTMSQHPFNGDTLFIKGSLSLYIQEKDYSLIKQLFPASDVLTIDQAGHWIHADKPKEFFEVVLSFIG